MFIVHYENGDSISESQTKWDDLPNREKIRAVQLKWDAYDFIKAIREKIDQVSLLIDGGQQFKTNILGLLTEYEKNKVTINEQRTLISNKVLGKAREVLSAVEDNITELQGQVKNFVELRKEFGTLSDEDSVSYTKSIDDLNRAEYHKMFFLNVIADMEAFLNVESKIATLVASSKYKYFFWQDKAAYYNLAASKDMGIVEQRMGMIIDKDGKTVVCEMNLRSGQYKVYVTTLDSLKLDLRVFPYIKLEEVG